MKSPTLLLSTAAAYGYLATLVSAVGGPSVPQNAQRLPGKPALMPNWSWPNPFPSADPSSTRITISSASEASSPTRFLATCSSTKTFKATEYLLDDLQELPPQGLLPWVEALRTVFANRPYPGSWDGVDPHGNDRNMLMMEYADLPVKVRRWIEEQEQEWSSSADEEDGDGKDSGRKTGKGLFAVLAKPDVEKGEKIVATATSLREKKKKKYDNEEEEEEEEEEKEWRSKDGERVVIFAPGAVYENAPLWVAAGSECEETLSDMTKYTAKPTDGAVVAYPVAKTQADRAEGKRDMEFTIKAQVLKVDESVPEDEEESKESKESEEGEKADGQFKPQAEKVEELKTKVDDVVDKIKTAVKDEL
ncbi:hypothetical protein QBC32DRAFT_97798 [Pseudoneurospora amorphoporcata]|uniref:Uncharacterized protein n=1 Tax=Pseudoneurospora amorphoporcata TaxID=241081 RepID=A0AAN6NJT7_9PEZI|nr:hypothetical protein QBC32DRAFT_97798 [Pseudoneurospora amorphoporcata]